MSGVNKTFGGNITRKTKYSHCISTLTYITLISLHHIFLHCVLTAYIFIIIVIIVILLQNITKHSKSTS